MSSTICSDELTEEQEQLLKSLEEEFKDRYTENDEGFLATMKETPPLPPVVENWRDFSRQDRSRSSHRFRGYEDRRSYGDRNSDRYSYGSRYDYRNRKRNHDRNPSSWH